MSSAPSLSLIVSTLKAAMEEKVKPQRPSGCGRVYVYVEKEAQPVLKQPAKALNISYMKRPYGVGVDAIYVGYDNATGEALSRGELLATRLREIGIKAYREEVSD